jgi:hypothetical protein
MKQGSGYIVTYKDGGGNVQKGIAQYSDQLPAFSKFKKVFIRCCNDDLSFKLDDKNKKVVTLKHESELTQIGFVD